MTVTELRVIESATGEVVRRLDVSGRSERAVEKIENGLLRQMDLERFHLEDDDDA